MTRKRDPIRRPDINHVVLTRLLSKFQTRRADIPLTELKKLRAKMGRNQGAVDIKMMNGRQVTNCFVFKKYQSLMLSILL